MTVLAGLLAKAGELAPEWAARGVDIVRDRAASAPPAVRSGLVAMGNVLTARKAELVDVAPAAVAFVAASLALGADENAVRLAWIRATATPDERDDARNEARAATVKAADDTARMWHTIKTVAQELLRVGGQAALPMLIALI